MQISLDKRSEQARAWRRRNPKWYLRWSAMRRAKAKGIEFNLSLEDIPEIPEICPIALIPLFIKEYDGTKGPCENSPTLDRIDTRKGYVPDNIRVISFRGNRWKADMSIEDMERLLSYTKGEI